MKTVRTILAAALLVMVCAVGTPALAGPQNGEVNHASGYTAPTHPEAETPDTWVDTFAGFFRFRDLIQLIPLDILIDGMDDPPSQD